MSVKAFLNENGLGEYTDVFGENGFDDLADVLRLTEADLKSIGIDKLGHRKKILRVLEEKQNRNLGHSLGRSGYTAKRPDLPFIAPPPPDQAPEDEQEEELDEDELEEGDDDFDGVDVPEPEPSHQKRRRSNTYTPASPVRKVRTQPRSHFGGDKIIVEVIAAKLEDKEKLTPQVKMSVCKTIDAKGVPIESTVRRTALIEGNQPSWHETFEFPAILTDQTYLVFAVNSKNSFSNKRVGLIAIPMKFFLPFTEDTVVDNWFPLKLGQGKRTGEIHLRLRVPGGVPSQVGKAYKVTGVKMETRKLVVEVIEAQVPPHKGHARSTYIKLTLPDKDFVCRETTVRKEATHPRWYEAFHFYTEVKNSQYLIVKLKNNKIMSHKTLGIAKIPLLFFLSLKEKAELDSWFPCRDADGHVAGLVRVRMFVRNRLASEKGQMWGREAGIPISSPVPPLPPPEKTTAIAMSMAREDLSASQNRGVMQTPPDHSLHQHRVQPKGRQARQQARAEDEEEEEEEAGELEEEEEDDEDDTWDVDDHEEDMTPYSPTRPAASGGVFWPPPEGERIDSSILDDSTITE